MRASRYGFVAVATAIVLGIQAMIYWGTPALSQGTALLPMQTTVTSITTAASQQLVAANRTRRFLTICNPSNSLAIWISPGATAAPYTAGSYLLVPIASTANFANSCFNTPVAGSVGAAWQVITSAGMGGLGPTTEGQATV